MAPPHQGHRIFAARTDHLRCERRKSPASRSFSHGVTGGIAGGSGIRVPAGFDHGREGRLVLRQQVRTSASDGQAGTWVRALRRPFTPEDLCCRARPTHSMADRLGVGPRKATQQRLRPSQNSRKTSRPTRIWSKTSSAMWIEHFRDRPTTHDRLDGCLRQGRAISGDVGGSSCYCCSRHHRAIE